jgi:hypothetical protein
MCPARGSNLRRQDRKGRGESEFNRLKEIVDTLVTCGNYFAGHN